MSDLAPEIQTGGAGEALYGGAVRVRRGRKRGGASQRSRRPNAGVPPPRFDELPDKEAVLRKEKAAAKAAEAAADPELASFAMGAVASANPDDDFLRNMRGVLAGLMSVSPSEAHVFKVPTGSYKDSRPLKSFLTRWRRAFRVIFDSPSTIDMNKWEEYRQGQYKLIDWIATNGELQNPELESECGDDEGKIELRRGICNIVFDLTNEQLFGYKVDAGMVGGGDDDDDETGMYGGADRDPSVLAETMGLVPAGTAAAAAARRAAPAAPAGAAAPAAADPAAQLQIVAAQAAGGAGAAPPAPRRGTIIGVASRLAGVLSTTATAYGEGTRSRLEGLEDRLDRFTASIRENPEATVDTLNGAAARAGVLAFLGSGWAVPAAAGVASAAWYAAGAASPLPALVGLAGAAGTLAGAAPALLFTAIGAGVAEVTYRVATGGGSMLFGCARRAPAAGAAAGAASAASAEQLSRMFSSAVHARLDSRAVGTAVGEAAAGAPALAAGVAAGAGAAAGRIYSSVSSGTEHVMGAARRAVQGGRRGRAVLEAPEVVEAIDESVRSADAVALAAQPALVAAAGGGAAAGAGASEASSRFRQSLSAAAVVAASDAQSGRKRGRAEAEAEAEAGAGAGAAPAPAPAEEDVVEPPATRPRTESMGGGCPTCGGSRKKRKSKAKKSRKQKKRASYRKRKHSKSHSPSEEIYASLPTPAATTLPRMESSGPPVRS